MADADPRLLPDRRISPQKISLRLPANRWIPRNEPIENRITHGSMMRDHFRNRKLARSTASADESADGAHEVDVLGFLGKELRMWRPGQAAPAIQVEADR